jgi:hypothetical protein
MPDFLSSITARKALIGTAAAALVVGAGVGTGAALSGGTDSPRDRIERPGGTATTPSAPDGTDVTVPTLPDDTTVPTLPDDDDDFDDDFDDDGVDNSGPGSVNSGRDDDGDDDHSGPGHGHDDDDGEDDRSGSNSGPG